MALVPGCKGVHLYVRYVLAVAKGCVGDCVLHTCEKGGVTQDGGREQVPV